MQKGTNVVKYNWLLSGEGIEMLNNKVDKGFLQLNTRLDRYISKNRQEHQMMIQMVKDLNEEQNKLKKIK